MLNPCLRQIRDVLLVSIACGVVGGACSGEAGQASQPETLTGETADAGDAGDIDSTDPAGADAAALDVPAQTEAGGVADVPPAVVEPGSLGFLSRAWGLFDEASGPHLGQIVVAGDAVYVANSFHGVASLVLDGSGHLELTASWPDTVPYPRCTTIAVHPASESLFCGAMDNSMGTDGAISRFDLGQPAAPAFVDPLAGLAPSLVHDLVVHGDRLLVSTSAHGLMWAQIDADGGLGELLSLDLGVRVTQARVGDQLLAVADADATVSVAPMTDEGPGVGVTVQLADLGGPALDLDVEGPRVAIALGSGGVAILERMPDGAVQTVASLQPRCVAASVALTWPSLVIGCVDGVWLVDLEQPAGSQLVTFFRSTMVTLDVARPAPNLVVLTDWHSVVSLRVGPDGTAADPLARASSTLQHDVSRFVAAGQDAGFVVRSGATTPMAFTVTPVGSSMVIEPGGTAQLSLGSAEIGAHAGPGESAALAVSVAPAGDANAAQLAADVAEACAQTCAALVGVGCVPEGADEICAGICADNLGACGQATLDLFICGAATPEHFCVDGALALDQQPGCEAPASAVLACLDQPRSDLRIHIRDPDTELAPAVGERMPLIEADVGGVTLQFPKAGVVTRLVSYQIDCAAQWPQLRDLAWLARHGLAPDGAEIVLMPPASHPSYEAALGIDQLAALPTNGATLIPEDGPIATFESDFYDQVMVFDGLQTGAHYPSDYIIGADGLVIAIEYIYRGLWPLRAQ